MWIGKEREKMGLFVSLVISWSDSSSTEEESQGHGTMQHAFYAEFWTVKLIISKCNEDKMDFTSIRMIDQ
jgi:hypothetical protein